MQKRYGLAAILAIFVVFAGCSPAPEPCAAPDSATLSVQLAGQETNMWCWAASGHMVMSFLGEDILQCTQANNRFGRSDCCDNPTPSGCITGGWPEFNKYGFTFDTTSNAPLTWEQIQQQIFCFGSPVAFSWHWNGGGGHMMVLSAYSTVDGTHYVTVHDPWPPNAGDVYLKTYSAYVSGPTYTHWDDYYNIERQ